MAFALVLELELALALNRYCRHRRQALAPAMQSRANDIRVDLRNLREKKEARSEKRTLV